MYYIETVRIILIRSITKSKKIKYGTSFSGFIVKKKKKS
jgi:hypothetical protein